MKAFEAIGQRLRNNLTSLKNQMVRLISSVERAASFVLYTMLIYGFYLTSGLYHEKMIKYEYENDVTGGKELLDEIIVFTFFPQLVATLISFLVLQYQKYMHNSYEVVIPWRQASSCSFCSIFSMYTYNLAIKEASFPAIIMIKSCAVLSVIIVALFCSRVKEQKLKLGQNKLFIGVIVTIGIFLFNYYRVTEENINDKPLTWLSLALITLSLIGDGFLPDFQASIKAELKPSSIAFYYYINKYTLIWTFLCLLLTLKIKPVLTFVWQCSEYRKDIFIFSCLNSCGQFVIYKMINQFKQHIPAFVIATRKCFTVLTSIVVFNHKIVTTQMIGIALVFSSVILEVYDNYNQNKTDNQLSQANASIQIQSIDIEDKQFIINQEKEIKFQLNDDLGEGQKLEQQRY